MGPPSGSDRVARGGGWDNGGWDCRSAKRFKDMPGSHYNNLGFRVSLVLPETAAESAKMSRSGDSVQTSGGSPANKPPLAVASVDSSSAVRLPAVGSLVGADGKWKLPPGAPPPAVAPFDEKQAKEHQAAWAKHLGVPVEITNSIGMKLVLIPPGEFMMGSPKELIEEELKTPDVDPWYKEHLPSEGPRHQVRITRPFCLGMYEVTQDEYQRVMGKNPSAFCATGNSKDAVAGQETKRFPVEQVSWDEAAEFCRKLSEMSEERAARRRYCLPTEAQWEYACRAGSQTQWHFGDEKPRLWEYGWFNENAGDKTHCVGQLKANPFGLFDMYGNVWEFCADWWYDKYYAITPEDDPTGSPAGSRRVRRGGSWTWTVPAGRCRSANRDSFTPGDNWADLGFRAALVLADAAGPD
jgi:formylglycine-generating enzyme required for sulfatase activity